MDTIHQQYLLYLDTYTSPIISQRTETNVTNGIQEPYLHQEGTTISWTLFHLHTKKYSFYPFKYCKVHDIKFNIAVCNVNELRLEV